MSAGNTDTSPKSRQSVLWLCALLVPCAIQLIPSLFVENTGQIGSPNLLFGITVAATCLGLIGSAMTMNRAKRTNEVELGYLGLFFFTFTILVLAHAFTTPGVLVEQNATSMSAAFWATPAALAAGIPAVLGRSKAGRSVDDEWRQWVSTIQYAIVAVAAMMLIFTDLIPQPTIGSSTTNLIVLASVLGCAVYSKRHYDLARIAQSNEPLLVSLGFGLIGGSMLYWLDGEPYSAGFWLSHFLLIFGVIAGTTGALIIYKRTDRVRPLIEKIIDVDPRCALEVGMEPSVNEYIDSLERNDPSSYEHVLRTTDLAMKVGPKLGVSGTDLRDLGLAAMLHDIGKLLIPDSILRKPGAIEEAEYEILKRHTFYGAEIVGRSKALASIAPAILAHHEHIDGSGYPIGLVGPKVPLNARIVAVCDAFDALSNTRQFRPDLDTERAIEIILRSAGSRWDRRVVDVVVRTVRSNPDRDMPEHLDVIGHLGCDCVPRIEAA